jgi:hypothetical protein
VNDIYITLAVEDQLSEIVARKLLEQSGREYRVSQCLCKQGQGYLKAKINNFNQAAMNMPFFVLTDQDRGCPPALISSWLKQKPSKFFMFRIAVMEVESWVMAHRAAFAKFFSVSLERLPQDMDNIPDPKQFLINLVRRSRSKRLRTDIVPAVGSTAKIGPDYNNHLMRFVQEKWDVSEAVEHSESLRRAVSRAKEFRHTF